jgi:hypothetical protein
MFLTEILDSAQEGLILFKWRFSLWVNGEDLFSLVKSLKQVLNS